MVANKQFGGCCLVFFFLQPSAGGSAHIVAQFPVTFDACCIQLPSDLVGGIPLPVAFGQPIDLLGCALIARRPYTPAEGPPLSAALDGTAGAALPASAR